MNEGFGRPMMMIDIEGMAAGLGLGMALLALALLVLGHRFPDIAGPRWWAVGAGMMLIVAAAWHWGDTSQLTGLLRSPLFVASLLVQSCGLVRFAGRGNADNGELAVIAMLAVAVGACRSTLPPGSDTGLIVLGTGLSGALGLVAGQAWRLGIEQDLVTARLAALLAAAAACIIAVCFLVMLVGAPLAHALDEMPVKAVIVTSLQALFLLWLGCLIVLAAQAAASRRRAVAADRNDAGAVATVVRRGKARAATAACICPSPPHCRRPNCPSARHPVVRRPQWPSSWQERPLIPCGFRPPSRRGRHPG